MSKARSFNTDMTPLSMGQLKTVHRRMEAHVRRRRDTIFQLRNEIDAAQRNAERIAREIARRTG